MSKTKKPSSTAKDSAQTDIKIVEHPRSKEAVETITEYIEECDVFETTRTPKRS